MKTSKKMSNVRKKGGINSSHIPLAKTIYIDPRYAKCLSPSQIGKQDLFAHRAVLAAASPYLMDLFNHEDEQPTRKEREAANCIVFQLNGGFRKYALEKLVEYAYTGR